MKHTAWIAIVAGVFGWAAVGAAGDAACVVPPTAAVTASEAAGTAALLAPRERPRAVEQFGDERL
jgi:hypothetical protein